MTAAQRDVLALMDQLDKPARIKVLEFMRREFGTGMVIELQPDQVFRVRRYVETIIARRGSACDDPTKRRERNGPPNGT
ncbi:hypothetical protein D5041_07805 [Verminephrobacter aporrectodeae subsp. tuberculatae]|nr:hypothetical protein [Verminephrobacter aporrectodeae subsp. tuberculatae]MCW5288967.1 hypothetical protein [Verminephrobacter aporrectodeae subsp. tuberculatae]